MTTNRRTFMAGSLAATAATVLPIRNALAQQELKLASFVPEPERRAALTKAILEAVRGVDREALKRRIASGKAPLHGIERSRPDVARKKRRECGRARIGRETECGSTERVGEEDRVRVVVGAGGKIGQVIT